MDHMMGGKLAENCSSQRLILLWFEQIILLSNQFTCWMLIRKISLNSAICQLLIHKIHNIIVYFINPVERRTDADQMKQAWKYLPIGINVTFTSSLLFQRWIDYIFRLLFIFGIFNILVIFPPAHHMVEQVLQKCMINYNECATHTQHEREEK